MPNYVIVPADDYDPQGTDFTNATYAYGVSDPAAVLLPNGVAHRAFELVLSEVSDEFTPVAPPSFARAVTSNQVTQGPGPTPNTFASVPIGPANANRGVGVIIGSRNARSLSSATIGGVTASIDAQMPNRTGRFAVITAAVPTGTTADLVLTFDGEPTGVGFTAFVYDVTGPALTIDPFVDGQQNSVDMSTTVLAPDRLLVAAVQGQDDGGGGMTGWNWTGLATVPASGSGNIIGNAYFSSAWEDNVAAGARTVQADVNGGGAVAAFSAGVLVQVP